MNKRICVIVRQTIVDSFYTWIHENILVIVFYYLYEDQRS